MIFKGVRTIDEHVRWSMSVTPLKEAQTPQQVIFSWRSEVQAEASMFMMAVLCAMAREMKSNTSALLGTVWSMTGLANSLGHPSLELARVLAISRIGFGAPHHCWKNALVDVRAAALERSVVGESLNADRACKLLLGLTARVEASKKSAPSSRLTVFTMVISFASAREKKSWSTIWREQDQALAGTVKRGIQHVAPVEL